MRNLKWE